MAEPLVSSGFRVVIPLVPATVSGRASGDGKVPDHEDFRQWLRGLIETETRRSHLAPDLVGFSMGGTLATLAAADGGVRRLVLIAPYFGLAWWLDSPATGASRLLKGVISSLPKLSRGKINDPDGYRAYLPGSFHIPVKGFLVLQQMAATAAMEARELELPILVQASPEDQVASFARIEAIFRQRKNVQIVRYPASNHILLYDWDSKDVVERIIKFLTVPGESGVVEINRDF